MNTEQYRLFFSWQNDRKETKVVINAALQRVKENLEAEGIDLFLDQDTRERTGKRKIDDEVLEKINKCDIFVADLTPITTYYPPKETHNLPKHMPNSNVMYEYGYALKAKGENRMIVLACLSKKENEHIEYMPFDINHDTITLFTDENSLCGLYEWVKKIIKDVDQERETVLPDYASALLFYDGKDFTNQVTIHPKYKRTFYVPKRPQRPQSTVAIPSSVTALQSSISKLQQVVSNSFSFSPVIPARVISKTTKLSYSPLHLFFFNQGKSALDNLHISIMCYTKDVSFADSNVEERMGFPQIKKDTSTFASGNGISQMAVTLNPHAHIVFDEVFVHTTHDIGSITLFWDLNSRSFQDKGELTVKVVPEYEDVFVENDELAGTNKVEDLEESE